MGWVFKCILDGWKYVDLLSGLDGLGFVLFFGLNPWVDIEFSIYQIFYFDNTIVSFPVLTYIVDVIHDHHNISYSFYNFIKR